MAVVALMGIDGSGKSTLSRALTAELERMGQPAVARWATLRPFLLVPMIKLAKAALVRKHPKTVDYGAHIQAKRSGMRRFGFLKPVYFALTVIDYLPQAWWKVGLPRLLGKHVICDRYFHDLALDYAITVGADTDRMMRILRFLGALVPTVDLHYFVAVPPEVAMARKDDVPSLAYLEERDAHYRAMAGSLALTLLDGQAPPQQGAQRVLDDMRAAGHLGAAAAAGSER